MALGLQVTDNGVQKPASAMWVYSGGGTNLAVNGGANVDATSWSGSFASVAYTNTIGTPYEGAGAIQVTSSTTGQCYGNYTSPNNDVTPGVTYVASIYVKHAATARSAFVYINWLNSSGSAIAPSAVGTAVTTTTSYQRISATGTAPAGAVKFQIQVAFASTVPGDQFFIDALQFELGSSPTTYVDGASSWRQVNEAWVFNNGTFQRFWPIQGTVTKLSAVPGATAYKDWTLNWGTAFSTSLTINQTSPTLFNLVNTTTQMSGSLALSLAPSTTYTVDATVNDSLGLSQTKSISFTTSSVPTTAPTGVTYGTLSGSVYPTTVTWTSVTGATNYDLYKLDGTTATLLAGNVAANSTTVNLNANTAYKLYVVTKYVTGGQTYSSGPGGVLSITVPKAGPPAGTYVFKPGTSRTWASGIGTNGGWRATTDLLYHGNGSAYGSTYGTQTSAFFSYTDNSNRGFTNAYYYNAVVTKCEIYVKRSSSGSGSSTPTAARFTQHNHTSLPTQFVSGTNYDNTANPLSYGEGTWLAVPASWGTALLAGTIKGIGWGNVSSGTPSGRYMSGAYTAAANGTQSTPIGSVRITVS